MAWAELKAHLLTKVEATTPSTTARNAYRRVGGGETVATTARTSGGSRKCELLPGSARLGPQVNGTAPKQVIQSATLQILYPVSGKPSEQTDAIEADKGQIRALLEDPRSYSFSSTGLQNCRVLGDSVSESEGGQILAFALELIYIGAN